MEESRGCGTWGRLEPRPGRRTSAGQVSGERPRVADLRGERCRRRDPGPFGFGSSMAPRDSSRWFSALAVLSLALSACGSCGGGGTVTAEGDVVLRPETLDFGLRSVGAQAEQRADVENLGRATVGVTWELEPGPVRGGGAPRDPHAGCPRPPGEVRPHRPRHLPAHAGGPWWEGRRRGVWSSARRPGRSPPASPRGCAGPRASTSSPSSASRAWRRTGPPARRTTCACSTPRAARASAWGAPASATTRTRARWTSAGRSSAASSSPVLPVRRRAAAAKASATRRSAASSGPCPTAPPASGVGRAAR